MFWHGPRTGSTSVKKPRRRRVNLTRAASSNVDEASSTFKRFDETWKGLLWQLRRNPEQGVVFDLGDDLEWRLYVSDPGGFGDIPKVWVIYRFTAKTLTVDSVHAELDGGAT